MKSTATSPAFFPERFRLLSAEEAELVNGGETFLYWLAYGLGTVLHTIGTSSGTQTAGQKAMNAALS